MNRIEEFRGMLGLSRPELASRVGVDRTMMWRYEKNLSNPSDRIKVRIAGVLNRSVEEIFLVILLHWMPQSLRGLPALNATIRGCCRRQQGEWVAIMKAKTLPKDISPNEAKLKAAIRVMVAVAQRILEKDKQSGLNPELISRLPVSSGQRQEREIPIRRKAGIM